MTTALYLLAVLTPLVLSGVAVVMIGLRSIERRAEDRIRAEHGLPPRAPRPARRLAEVEAATAPPRTLRRRVAEAFEPETVLRTTPARPAGPPAAGRTPKLPWPLQDAGAPDDIRVTRADPVPAVDRPAQRAATADVTAPAPPTARRLAISEAPAPTVARTGSPSAPPPAPAPSPQASAPMLPPAPERDADGARAALARAAATLQELERAADQAERYGTKECPACDQSVRLTARVCPHCRHRMAPEPGQRDVTAA